MTDMRCPHDGVERSCALTAVAFSRSTSRGRTSGDRRAPRLRLEHGARLRPRPVPVDCAGLDAQNLDLRCGASVFAVEGASCRVSAERAVDSRTPCAHAGRERRRAGLDRVPVARAAARDPAGAAGSARSRPATWMRSRCSIVRSRWPPREQPLEVILCWAVCRWPTPRRRDWPTSCDAAWAGCRGPQRRSGCRGRTRCRWAATAGCATRTCRRRAGRRTTISTSPRTTGPAFRTRSGTPGRRAFMPDHVAVLERARTSRTRQPGPVSGRPAEVVRGTHPPRDEEPPGGRLRPRRRSVRRPLHRRDDR